MNNLLLLTKINLKSMFKSNNSKKKNKGLLVFILLYIYFAFLIYQYAKILMEGYSALNATYLLLPQFMVITSFMIILTNIYRVGGTLFNFKDYDLLMSIPIKRSIVILSKIVMLYIVSLIYTFILMIPSLIAYVTNTSVTEQFYIFYFITLFIIPLVPLVISSVIGTLITAISSRFNKKNIVNYIFTILLFIGAMYLSFSLENVGSVDMANIGKSMVNMFNKVYPLTNMYVNIIKEGNILSLLMFILIPVVLFYIFIYFTNKYYIKINSNLKCFKKKNNYVLINKKSNSQLIALYKKEIKRYFSSVVYFTNTAMGSLMVTFGMIALLLFGKDKLAVFLSIPELANYITVLSPLIISSFVMFNISTHSSISIEGKNLWIIKSIPVDTKKIFLSKIMVNLTVLIPTILVNSTILSIYLKPNALTIILMYITPLIYALFISILGLIINMHFPIFDWTSEVKVIKQSLASFLTLMIGLVFAVLPFMFIPSNGYELYILLITGIMLILTILSYIYMNTKCVKMFRKL